MAIVRIEQVSKRYRQDSLFVDALTDIDLEVQQGEFVSLIGPSGSGKTTLLNLIGALDLPTTGRIWIEDREIGQLSKRTLSKLRLRKIGFIFQEYNLIPYSRHWRTSSTSCCCKVSLKPNGIIAQ